MVGAEHPQPVGEQVLQGGSGTESLVGFGVQVVEVVGCLGDETGVAEALSGLERNHMGAWAGNFNSTWNDQASSIRTCQLERHGAPAGGAR